MFTFAKVFLYESTDYFCDEVTMSTVGTYRLNVALLLTHHHGSSHNSPGLRTFNY